MRRGRSSSGSTTRQQSTSILLSRGGSSNSLAGVLPAVISIPLEAMSLWFSIGGDCDGNQGPIGRELVGRKLQDLFSSEIFKHHKQKTAHKICFSCRGNITNCRRNASAKTVCQTSEPALVGSTHLFLQAPTVQLRQDQPVKETDEDPITDQGQIGTGRSRGRSCGEIFKPPSKPEASGVRPVLPVL